MYNGSPEMVHYITRLGVAGPMEEHRTDRCFHSDFSTALSIQFSIDVSSKPTHTRSIRPHHTLLYPGPALFLPSSSFLTLLPLPPLLAESGRQLSCVATATAASSSTCCPPLPFIPPSFSSPSSPSPPCPPPPPPSVPLTALCLPLFTSEETPSSGGKRRAVSPHNTPVCQ